MSEQVKKGWLHTREGDKFVPITLVENVYSRSGTPYDNIVKQYLAEWKSDNDTDITDIRAELNSQATDISNLENIVNVNHTEILERLKNFEDTDDGTLWISDTSGNIIAYINADGLHALDVEIKSGMTMSQLESDVAKLQTDAIDLDGRLDAIDSIFGAYDETSKVLYIIDKDENVIAYIDDIGVHSINLYIQGARDYLTLDKELTEAQKNIVSLQEKDISLAKDIEKNAASIVSNAADIKTNADNIQINADNIDKLEDRATTLETIVGNDNSGLVKQANDNTAAINKNAEDITKLDGRIGFEESKRVENEARITEVERKTKHQDARDEDEVLYIIDNKERVIAYVDDTGIHSINVYSGDNNINTELEFLRQEATDLHQNIVDEAAARIEKDNQLETKITSNKDLIDGIHAVFGGYDNTSTAFYIIDKDNNVVAYFDASGLNVIDVTIGDKNSDKYALYKVITDLLTDDIEIHKQLDNHENRVNVLEAWKPDEIAAREEVAANLSKVANFYVSQEKAPRNNGDLALDDDGNLTIWNGLIGDWEDFIGLSRQLKEKTQYFDGSSSDSFYIVDKNDKVVAYFDKEGFHAIRVYVGGLDDNEQYEVYQDLTTLYTNLDIEKQRSERIDTDHEERLSVIEKQIHALGNIMQFAGAVDTAPADVSGYQDGDVIVEISSGKEYVLSNGVWVELGDTSAELEAIQRLQAIVGDPGTIEKTHEARLDLLETNLAEESDAREEADKAINDTLDSLQANMNWTNSDGKLFIIDDNNNVIAYFDEEGLTTYNTTIQTLKNGNIEYKKNLQVNGIYFSDKQSVQINWLD